MQNALALLVLAAAVGYLGWRVWRRRTTNCCGEVECPAAKQMVEKFRAN